MSVRLCVCVYGADRSAKVCVMSGARCYVVLLRTEKKIDFPCPDTQIISNSARLTHTSFSPFPFPYEGRVVFCLYKRRKQKLQSEI